MVKALMNPRKSVSSQGRKTVAYIDSSVTGASSTLNVPGGSHKSRN